MIIRVVFHSFLVPGANRQSEVLKLLKRTIIIPPHSGIPHSYEAKWMADRVGINDVSARHLVVLARTKF